VTALASALDKKLDEALAEHQAGRFVQAEAGYRKVLAQAPQATDAIHFLGLLLHQTKRSAEGIELMRRSLALAPNIPMYHYNLGNALRGQLKYDEAVEFLRRATQLGPKLVDAWIQLGNCLRAQAKLDEAIEAFKKVAGVVDSAGASNLLYTLWLHPRFDVEAIVNEHRRWASAMADPITAKAPPHRIDRDPNRRIRVGYVSQDFWKHVLGRYIEPILAHHDRKRFEIFCYADGRHEDEVTARIRAHVDQWRVIRDLSHDRVAQMVREDRIDILVDLAAHSGVNRLAVFARKPAPAQVTYLGYPATTGMRAMDYRITDIHLDPPGETEAWHTEKLVRLPHCYWCFPVPADAPKVNELPALRNGLVTFGSYNTFAKVNPELIRLWARILQEIPTARLRIVVPGGIENNRHVMGMLLGNGLPADRLDVVPSRPYAQYLASYHEIDISLDSFPYNGGATSLDAAFMGVPIVTLTGKSMVSRGGVTVLQNLDLPELIAHMPDEYVTIAATLARDVERLRRLRGDLRSRMLASPLADPMGLTRNLEAEYLQMWKSVP
jgi:protein O-GlcNAc transferase